MSVQNLRNKFSQNNGAVPFSPPGLSYGKPTLNNNHMMNCQKNGVEQRFKTIAEEQDENDKPAKKNNSFLQSYLATEMTKNGSAAGEKTSKISPPVSKFVTRSSPIVTNVESAKSTVKSSTPHLAKTVETASKNNSRVLPSSASAFSSGLLSAKSPPPPIPADAPLSRFGVKSPPPVPADATPSRFGVKSPPAVPADATPSRFGVKSPPPVPADATPSRFGVKSPPTAPVDLTTPSRYGIKSPPPSLSDSSTSKFSSSVSNRVLTKSTGEDKWKAKYDETETKRKSLLTQSQKLLMEKSDMERQVLKLRTDLDTSDKELKEKTVQLSQLRKLSEAMYKEYDQLKQQYELETGTLQKAMERASQWYKQNRELKRRSSVLMQKVISVAPDTLNDLADDTDGNDNDTEMEELRKTVKDLTQEISRLQAELNKIKLQEFEAQEQTVDLTSELEEERRARKHAEQELKELTMKHANLENVSRKVVEETTVLHERYKREKEEGVKIRSDANKVKSERDVLARQSQLLMMDAASDEKIMKLLFEIEHLQRTLHQERQEHAEQLKDLQDKLESQSESEQIELYEEKLKLTEAELLCSQQKAEIAESQVEELKKKLNEAKMAVQSSCVSPPSLSCAPPPPPPPPPPPMSMPPAPPPPPPPMALTPNLQNIKLRTVSALNSTNGDSNAIEEIGNYLGLASATKSPQVQNGAIDAIINQIKGGRFSLRATDKEKQTPVKKQEPPAVVNEMMNVLGTLRRNPKRRASFKTAPADVAL